MGANRLTTGNTVPYTPVADVAAGDMIKFGVYVGIAENDILAGEVGALAVNGVFRIDANIASIDSDAGLELDVDLATMKAVVPTTGDADIKVFTAEKYDVTDPDYVDVWINKVG